MLNPESGNGHQTTPLLSQNLTGNDMILKYSKITRFLHWITAILVIALFVSGWYMVELDYYSNWYQTLPELHILGGVILLLLWLFVLLRLFRTNKNNFSQPHKPFERFAAQWVKRLFYVLVVVWSPQVT